MVRRLEAAAAALEREIEANAKRVGQAGGDDAPAAADGDGGELEEPPPLPEDEQEQEEEPALEPEPVPDEGLDEEEEAPPPPPAEPEPEPAPPPPPPKPKPEPKLFNPNDPAYLRGKGARAGVPRASVARERSPCCVHRRSAPLLTPSPSLPPPHRSRRGEHPEQRHPPGPELRRRGPAPLRRVHWEHGLGVQVLSLPLAGTHLRRQRSRLRPFRERWRWVIL